MYKFIMALLAIGALSSSLALAEPITLCPDADATHRYIVTKLRAEHTDEKAAGKIRLFFKLLAPFDPAKPTLIALPGGPGGDHTDLDDMAPLSDSMNVVTTDHRGVGCTTITSSFQLDYEAQIYSMSRATDDLEAIRKDLLGPNGAWYVYGVSYGSMLAQQYAIRYPNSILGLVLDSTDSDYRSISLTKSKFLKLFIEHDPVVKQMYDEILNRYPDFKNLLLRKIFYATYWYKGRTRNIPNFFQKVLDAPSREAAQKLIEPGPLNPMIGMLQQIWCEEFYDYQPTSADGFFWPEDSLQCPIYRPFRKPMVFDENLKALTMPVLIMGSTFDPVTPIEEMQKMSRLIPHAVLWTNQFSGHGLYEEKKECAARLIRMFVAQSSLEEIGHVAEEDICQSPPDISGKDFEKTRWNGPRRL